MFKSRLVKNESRKSVDLLKMFLERSDELIRMCSIRGKIHIVKNKWLEVEDAIVALSLFEKEKLPQISHGLCPPCYERVIAELDGLSNRSWISFKRQFHSSWEKHWFLPINKPCINYYCNASDMILLYNKIIRNPIYRKGS